MNNIKLLFKLLSQEDNIKESNIKALNRLKIFNYRDLLFHIPNYYIKKSLYPDLNNTQNNQHVILKVKINDIDIGHKSKNRPNKIYVSNHSGNIELVFFNYIPNFILSLLKIGNEVTIEGKIKKSNFNIQIHHPELITNSNLISEFEPIYPLSYGIINKQIILLINNILTSIDDILLPTIENKLVNIKEILLSIHQPKKIDNLESIKIMAELELFSNQIILHNFKQRSKITKPYKIKIHKDIKQDILQYLNFTLTPSQTKVIKEIENDLESEYKMTRMLQGDVGSGKTLVALLTIINVVKSGKQVAFMAPTDLLAKQHFKFFKDALNITSIRITLLTGSHKLKEKKQIYKDLETGNIDILIGTHALFQTKVIYKDLGYVIIDEQHRFGVEQRSELTKKGEKVDLLIMTATPIPRSLTLTIFGDMPVSKLTDKPQGRIPIITSSLSIKNIEQLYQKLNNILNKKEKIFWVCPLIEDEKEKDRYINVIKRSQELEILFPNKIFTVHGKMKSLHKDQIMLDFQQAETGIMVATTVIEVGIDIKEATLIIIENAEKFGLAQIHQLRGRVGRNNKQSYCILLYGNILSNNAKQRIKILKDTNDGFVIAEEDLLLRGGGDILGKQQSGEQNFYFADLSRDQDLLLKANKVLYKYNLQEKIFKELTLLFKKTNF